VWDYVALKQQQFETLTDAGLAFM
jgi:hypothetical protein